MRGARREMQVEMSTSLTFGAPTCHVVKSRLIMFTYRRRQFQHYCSEANIICSGRSHQQIHDSIMRMIVCGIRDLPCVSTPSCTLIGLAKIQSLQNVDTAAQAAMVSLGMPADKERRSSGNLPLLSLFHG